MAASYGEEVASTPLSPEIVREGESFGGSGFLR
jgi:hypothetical protein